MNVVFAGTPAFAVHCLHALLARHRVLAVYTQPDRPAGRGRQVCVSAVKKCALENNIPLYQPAHLTEEATKLKSLQADLMVVCAYGLLLPPELLEAPRLGCINVHASLLPRWRGASPVLHAIMAGDRETGVSLMQMAHGLDTGDILCQASCAIAHDDTRGTLEDKLSVLGARLLTRALPKIQKLRAQRTAQEESLITHAPKMHTADALLNWHDDAETIARRIRAFNPQPGARTFYRDELLKVWRARVVGDEDDECEDDRRDNHSTSDALSKTKVTPGTIVRVHRELWVQCGTGVLSLLCLQRAGGRALAVTHFINGAHSVIGECFGRHSE